MPLHHNLLFFFNFAEVFFLFVLLRDSLEELLSILLVTLSDDPVTAALQLHMYLLSGEASNKSWKNGITFQKLLLYYCCFHFCGD